MKILIIDDSADFRSLLRLHINKGLKNAGDVEIVEYDFDRLGKPADDYNWPQYDVLFLDYKLGPSEDGLQWLKEFKGKPGFPPTIILTAEGDEYVAVKSIKLGAADYVNKVDISPTKIAEMIDEALQFSRESTATQERSIQNAVQIIEDIGTITAGEKEIGYKFVRMIGEGAMSKVYLAERVQDKSTVVLKMLDLEHIKEEELVRRFIQEAELISKLHSPFIVRIDEYEMSSRYGFIAMEFFSRGDLKQRMQMGLDQETAIIYTTHIAYGLDQVHNIGIVHRDLKPANVMFRGDGSLALADFGISKDLASNTGDITELGQVLGTPHYMSPEQGQGHPVDPRADLYSAGILFYELLTGEKAYYAETAAALIHQHIYADIPRLPDDLLQYQDIIHMTMAKNPDDRFQTAQELIQALEYFQ